MSNNPPFAYIYEDPDLNRNPFRAKTLIDCDKKFFADQIEMDLAMCTTSRNNVCNDLFLDILNTLESNLNLYDEHLNSLELESLNYLITYKST